MISIPELDEYFAAAKENMPAIIKIDSVFTITDVPKFIDSHLTTLKTYPAGSNSYIAFYNRLIKVKDILQNG